MQFLNPNLRKLYYTDKPHRPIYTVYIIHCEP